MQIRAWARVTLGWKAPRVASIVRSSRTGEASGLGNLEQRAHRESAGATVQERQGCQRLGSTRSDGRTGRITNLRRSPPKRIRRRETPVSPVSRSRVQARWPRARRKPRREAGKARDAGARYSDRGKQKSVERIVLSPRRASQDKRQVGELARSKSCSVDAMHGGS